MSPDNALAELRLTSRAEHDRLEGLLRLAQPMSMARYATVMAGLDAFLRAWEPRVQAALPERLQPWFRTRRRGGFASADVEWLRSVAGAAAPAPVASAAAALPLGDIAEVLGSIYVVEDFALGGRTLAPRLKSAPGVAQGRGASYFHGFGGEAGVMWNNFRVLAALEIGESSKSTVRACQSAKRTYGALVDVFAGLAPAAAPAPAPRPPIRQEIAPSLLRAFEQRDPAPTPAGVGAGSDAGPSVDPDATRPDDANRTVVDAR